MNKDLIAKAEQALSGLDEAYCRAGPELTSEERFEDRKRLSLAREVREELHKEIGLQLTSFSLLRVIAGGIYYDLTSTKIVEDARERKIVVSEEFINAIRRDFEARCLDFLRNGG